MNGYGGRILFVDLSDGASRVVPLTETTPAGDGARLLANITTVSPAFAWRAPGKIEGSPR